MKKLLAKLFSFLLVIAFVTSIGNIGAKKSAFSCKPIRIKSCKSYSKKTYTKKTPYEGFGKTSKANGRIKTKGVKGYVKPKDGYKFVNPYSKSK